ncbi:hypothetical protein WMY93_022506 [Mugilogobius chulae]|uniref:Uncharacterized protein n=1 Tax=Mugilogobius chulae TaxID=88201 RepID=A0AAW0NBF9_9GOBI
MHSAVVAPSVCLLGALLELSLLGLVHSGAYYPHKQPSQPLPQYSEPLPQQQYLGKRCPCFQHSFHSCLCRRAKRGPCPRAKVRPYPLTLEEQKAHPTCQRVFEKDLRGCQALKGPRGHKALQDCQDKECQVYQDHQGLPGYRDTQGLANLECQEFQANQGLLDYLDRKVNSAQTAIKGPLALLGLRDFLAHLDYLEFLNQGVRGSQANQDHSESQDRKAFLDNLVLKAPKEREGLVFLVYRV